MGLFIKRPLAAILCILTCGFIFFSAASGTVRAISALCAFALFAASFGIKYFKGFKRKLPIIALLLSFLLSFLYFDVLFYPDIPTDDGEVTLTGTVTYTEDTDYGKVVDLKTETKDSAAYSYNIKLYLYGADFEVKPGYKISFKTKLQPLDSSGEFDFKAYYTARGFCATATATEITVLDSTGAPPLSYRISALRRSICSLFCDKFGTDEGGLVSALLLGERELMSDSLKLSFSRIGISHLLALSGMHLVILTAAIERILKLLRVGRIPRLLISCIFVLAFMTLTSFPLSVCRAGTMMIISILVYLLSGSKDNLTSLFIGLTLILIAEPYAAFDSGLWLSALATLGILAASELAYRRTFSKRKFLNSFMSAMFVSLFAVSATFALTVLLFDGFSFISPITTYIFGFLTELYMYAALILLALSVLFPSAPSLIAPLYKAIYALSKLFSDKVSFVYTPTSAIPVVIGALLITLLLFCFILIKVKNKRPFVLAIAVLYAFTSVFSISAASFDKTKDTVIYTSEGYDALIVRSEGEVSLIQASNDYTSSIYSTVNAVFDERITEIDNYIVTSYVSALDGDIETLLSRIKVSNLILPKPKNEYEHVVSVAIYENAITYGIAVNYYDEQVSFNFSDSRFLQITRSEYKDSFYSNTFLFYINNELYTYTTAYDLRKLSDISEIINATNYLIIGSAADGKDAIQYVGSASENLRAVVVDSKSVVISSDISKSVSVHITPSRVVIK